MRNKRYMSAEVHVASLSIVSCDLVDRWSVLCDAMHCRSAITSVLLANYLASLSGRYHRELSEDAQQAVGGVEYIYIADGDDLNII